MGRKKEYVYIAADFETTVFQGQTFTEVWSAAYVELHTEKVHICHSIREFLDAMRAYRKNLIVYFHNLKFDGHFLLYHFIKEMGLQQATQPFDRLDEIEFKPRKKMQNNTIRYSISEMGQWYSILWKVNDRYIEFRDSLKLLPFSLANIGRSFKTKHQKLTMEYEGVRYAGCTISQEEQEYIKNDVLVLKEALEIMFQQGHDDLTIGSCCLKEFKLLYPKIFDDYFPDMYNFRLDPGIYGEENAGEYIRRAYRGGWCYLQPEKAGKVFRHGLTADVNSLYPSMMHSDSGNVYPVGNPIFWSGNYIPDICGKSGIYYYVRFQCRFFLKKDHLPTVQIKGNLLYPSTQYLASSDIPDPENPDILYPRYYDLDNVLQTARPTLTMSCTDFQLLQDHYDLQDLQILDGCYFSAERGLFDEYINKYAKIKQESTGAMRTLAKLFLNNLYGKFAATPDSSFQYAYVEGDDPALHFISVQEANKKPGYIPIGAAVTSYARNFTIRSAQKNYKHFIYADTDSIHCSCDPADLVGVPVDPVKFQHWAIESQWDEALFIRAKTYLEHVTVADGKEVSPHYDIKCAGMPERCKQLFLRSVQGSLDPQPGEKLLPEEIAYLAEGRKKITDFNYGLRIPGKLLPKRIPKGVLLVNSYYEMRR